MDRTKGPCSCPDPVKSLPEDLSNAALQGLYDRVYAYVESGGDVNACCTISGWTLLGAACCGGYPRIVEKLLGYSNLHLNVHSMNSSPLTLAIDGKNDHCVELLLRSNLKCQLDVTDSWHKLLNFKSSKPMLLLDIINRLASYFNIEKLTEIICRINPKFVLDIKLTKAAAERNPEAVAGILNSKDIEKFLDGTLIAVSSLGTNERVARLLVRHPYEYNIKSVETSLILCAMNNSLGIMPLLINRFFPLLNYETLSNAQEAAALENHVNACRLLDKALIAKCKNLIFLSKPRKVGGVLPNLVSETPGNSSLDTPPEAIELGIPALEETGGTERTEDVPRLSDLAKDTLTATGDPAKGEGEEEIDTLIEKILGGNSVLSRSEANKLLKEISQAQTKVAEVLTQAAQSLSITSKAVGLISKTYTKETSSPESTETSEDS